MSSFLGICRCHRYPSTEFPHRTGSCAGYRGADRAGKREPGHLFCGSQLAWADPGDPETVARWSEEEYPAITAAGTPAVPLVSGPGLAAGICDPVGAPGMVRDG
jgi:hypothetical protein